MKTLIIAIITLASIGRLNAQTCKIKIYYDQNGNRIQRVEECPSEHPDPNTVELRSTQKPVQDFGSSIEGSYQVFPNPAENKVNIKLDAYLIAQGCSINMTDLTGKVLYQQQKVSNSVSAINLQGYADGTYFIIIATANDRHTVKIVKQSGSGF